MVSAKGGARRADGQPVAPVRLPLPSVLPTEPASPSAGGGVVSGVCVGAGVVVVVVGAGVVRVGACDFGARVGCVCVGAVRVTGAFFGAATCLTLTGLAGLAGVWAVTWRWTAEVSLPLPRVFANSRARAPFDSPVTGVKPCSLPLALRRLPVVACLAAVVLAAV